MNNYVIYEPIGKGEFTEVQKGRKKKSIEFVILKSFAKSQKDRVFNEVKILSSLKHENIIAFNYWYETRNHYWVIYEYVCGGDLRKVIEKESGMKEDFLKSIAVQLIEGLFYLHSQRVIFCDFKPSNLVFNEFCVLKYVDFSNARFESDLNIETTTSVLYSPPEVLSGLSKHSFKSDIFGLGVLLYELAKGTRPFSGTTAESLLAEYKEKVPARIETYSEEFSKLIEKMLEINPKNRINLEDVKNSVWIKGEDLSVKTKAESANEKKDSMKLEKEPSLNGKQKILNDDLEKKSVRSYQSAIEKLSLTRTNSTIEKSSPPINTSGKEGHSRGLSDNLFRTKQMRKNESASDNAFDALNSQKRKSTETKYGRSPNTSQITDLEKSASCLDESVEDVQPKVKFNIPFISTEDFFSQPPKELFQISTERSISQIIFNPEIEKFEPTEQGSCDISLISESDVNQTEAAQTFLFMAYKHLPSEARTTSKIALLDHMSKLSASKAFANLIAESTIFQMLVNLLQSAKTRSLKIAVCTLIGVVLKNTDRATLSIQSSVLIDLLVLNYGEVADLVRSRSMAALGEFLFYLSYQPESKSATSAPEPPIFLLLRVFSNPKDELTICYALKTLENITTLSQKIGPKFATPDFVSALLSLLKIRAFKRLNFIRRVCFIILTNLLKFKMSLKTSLIERESIELILPLLRTDNSKLVLAIINFLITLLSEFSDKLAKMLFELIPIFLYRLMEWLVKGDLLLQTKVVLLINCMVSTNVLFIRLIPDFSKFLAAVKKINEPSQSIESTNRKAVAVAEYSIKVSASFFVLLKSVCNKLLNDFYQGLPKQKNPDSIQYLLFCISIPSVVISTEGFSEMMFEGNILIQTLSISYKYESIYENDLGEVLDAYCEFIQHFLANLFWTQKLQSQLLNTILENLALSINNQTREETQTNQFKILIEIFNKACPDEINDKWKKLANLIFDFCRSLFSSNDPHRKYFAVRNCRTLLEKKMVQIPSIDAMSFVNSLISIFNADRAEVSKDQLGQNTNDSPSQVSLNIFALLFYVLASNLNFIYDYQSLQLFDFGVRFLLEFPNCYNLPEIFGFFTLYLEISHKRLKQNMVENQLVFKGSILSSLFAHVINYSESFEPFVACDMVLLIYYGIHLILHSKKGKGIVITPPVRLDVASLMRASFLKVKSEDKAITKKQLKIEKMLGQVQTE